MITKTDNPISMYKLIFLTITPFLLILCSLTLVCSAEKKEKDTGEIKNNVFSLYDREMGRVGEKGTVFNIYGRELGSVDENGIIKNVSGVEIGKVEPDGSILNQSGTRLGSVNEKGDILNVSDRKIGLVKDISDIKLTGGAARLIFLK
ncbi:MAG: hypothetical protein PVG39_13390 [Desulfobacteraceae bacterium]|jgi:hypothetical protein